MFKLFSQKYEIKYDLSRLTIDSKRNFLVVVFNYRKNISQLKIVSQYKAELAQIDSYIDEMYELANHINAFNSNELIKNDILMIPRAIKETQHKIKYTEDSDKLKDLERRLSLLKQQEATLEQTKNSLKLADARFHELFSLVQLNCLEILAS